MYPIVPSILDTESQPQDETYIVKSHNEMSITYKDSNFDDLIVEYFVQCLGQDSGSNSSEVCKSLKDKLKSTK